MWAKVIKAIEQAWQALQETLERVPEGQIGAPGIVGDWSVKDLIGHITTWEAEAIDSIRRYSANRDVKTLEWPDVDKFNEQTVAAKRPRPLADLKADFEETHRHLARFVA